MPTPGKCEPLDSKGYNTDLAGDPSCYRIGDLENITLSMRLNCSFTAGPQQARMGVYLPGYKIKSSEVAAGKTHFDYYMGSEVEPFAISLKPIGSVKRCCQGQSSCFTHSQETGLEVKFFNMDSLTDCTHSYTHTLTPDQWLGRQTVEHSIAVSELDQQFITTVRIYTEIRMRGFYTTSGNQGLKDSNVVKRFFDIQGYIEPAGKSLVERNLGWVIAGIIVGILLLTMFVRNCCWKDKHRA